MQFGSFRRTAYFKRQEREAAFGECKEACGDGEGIVGRRDLESYCFSVKISQWEQGVRSMSASVSAVNTLFLLSWEVVGPIPPHHLSPSLSLFFFNILLKIIIEN